VPLGEVFFQVLWFSPAILIPSSSPYSFIIRGRYKRQISGQCTKWTLSHSTQDTLLTYLFTELSPSWETANCAATQELPTILCNPKVQYRVHKSPPVVPIVSHIDPVHTIPSYLFRIYFNIIHPPTSWSSYLFPSGCPTNILYGFRFPPFMLHALPILSSLT
jgi:hypothetical protein